MIVHRERRPHVLLPLLLVALGAVLLAMQLGALSWDVWPRLFNVWPLLIVLLGLELIVGATLSGSAARVVALLLMALVVLAGLGIAVGWAGSPSLRSGTLSPPLASAGAGNLEVTIAGGDVTLTTADLGDRLYTADYSLTRGSRISGGGATFQAAGQAWTGWDFGASRGERVDLVLNRSVPWTLKLTAASINGNLDLRGVTLDGLTVAAAAGDLRLELPPTGSAARIDLSGAAMRSQVTLDPAALARARVSGLATALTVNGQDGWHGNWSTPGWTVGGPGYDIRVSAVSGRLEISR